MKEMRLAINFFRDTACLWLDWAGSKGGRGVQGFQNLIPAKVTYLWMLIMFYLVPRETTFSRSSCKISSNDKIIAILLISSYLQTHVGRQFSFGDFNRLDPTVNLTSTGLHRDTYWAREASKPAISFKGLLMEISIIVPVHNGSSWLEECLSSVLLQSYRGSMELSVYDDASTDGSRELIETWRQKLKDRQIELIISGHSGKPKGVGYAKNQAIAQSSGKYLCFLDADDVMHPHRISSQVLAAMANPKAIVGCRFHREPPNSTPRFTDWANNMSQDQLVLQVFTSHGPSVIMPTWFCNREIVDRVGGFDESGKGTPEDLLFFQRHLDMDGTVVRVDEDLLMYRYHPQAETFSIAEETIWRHRVQFLERRVLCSWKSFSIWNAGKQGRKLYRSLSPGNRSKVKMFCDVDENKIQKGYYIYEESKESPKPKIPIVHFSSVRPPVVICVKMGLSGNFEVNLSSLGLKEGTDYIHFN
ncbi:UDP-glcnac:betagal beta-1,3-n-acetylglucosaminyltransferase-like protein 1 [Plakobranchus ocellatus]|uniref:UDP-glcnac:betagal beta-1,3-n-acetylglucosaminyltransferase-like protein 1 n=1 Tax=Plakobranchus ocellatus TaxID=259542 RepID=A0AAV4D3H6_9GAST|nr:UDP-glcnac:betagal beta-1,3-n-acetylglucosaminyltransferase-like protein 1 [Plakobranchus ocellatus]